MKTCIVIGTLLLSVGLMVYPVFSQDLEEGLVAYWDFNNVDGETVSDVSGNEHHGMLIGDPEWITDGKYGGGIEFDGNGDEIFVEYHADLNPEVFTICAWANVAVGSTGHRAVVSSRADFPQRGYIFYAEPNGNIWEFWIGAGADSWKPVRGPAANLGEWDHVLGTYADGNHKFYVNGEFVGEENFEISVNPNEEFLIGAGANETAAHNYRFVGIIDEVRLYNRVLDEREISAVMKSDSLAVEASGKIAVTWGKLKVE